MKKRFSWKQSCFLLWIVACYITGSISLSDNQNTFRRVHDIAEVDSEFIADPQLAKAITPQLVLRIASDLPVFQVIFANRPDNCSPGTWKIGIVLAFLKNIEGLGLKQLDIAKWMQSHKEVIKESVPSYDLVIPDSAFLFENAVEDFKASSQESYLALQSECINYYFINFAQAFTEHDLFNMPRDGRESFILGEDMLNLHNRRKENIPRQRETDGLVPSDYLPDLYALGSLKTTDPEAYQKEINGYLLRSLIKFELKGYAQRWLSGVKYYEDVIKIKYDVFQDLDIASVKDQLKSFYSKFDISEEIINRVIKNADDHLLRDLLIDFKIKQKMAPDIDKFVKQNYPALRRLIWSAFYNSPYSLQGGKLIDTLTISEAEYMARQITQMYFNKMTTQIPTAAGKFDPHAAANKNKNRISFLDWGLTEQQIQSIIEASSTSLQTTQEPTAQQLRLQRNITYFLLKKLATAGVYDLSIEQVRSRFSSSASLSGLEDSQSLRKYRFEINSFNHFFENIIANRDENIKLVISADNNGEVIYLLGFIKYILQINPNLTVFLIPRSIPVADDVYSKGLFRILEYDAEHDRYFTNLDQGHSAPAYNSRFLIAADGPDSQGEYLRIMSHQEYSAFTDLTFAQRQFDKIAYLGIGNANFVSTQGLDMDRYYIYRVKAQRVAEATGIPAEGNPLIFAYLEPGICIGTDFGGNRRYNTLDQYVKSHTQFYIPDY